MDVMDGYWCLLRPMHVNGWLLVPMEADGLLLMLVDTNGQGSVGMTEYAYNRTNRY